MVWECRQCGYQNRDTSTSCAKCTTSREVATTMVIRRKKYCDECGHLHRHKFYCHVYVHELKAFNPEDEVDSDDDPEDLESDTKSAATGALTVKSSASMKLPEDPLDTPAYVKSIGWRRCNCRYGIPKGNKRFQQPPKPGQYQVGDITVQTYEVMQMNDQIARGTPLGHSVSFLQDKLSLLKSASTAVEAELRSATSIDLGDSPRSVSPSKQKNGRAVTFDEGDGQSVAAGAVGATAGNTTSRGGKKKDTRRLRAVDRPEFSEAIPVILSFIALRQCSLIAAVNRTFYNGLLAYPDYIDTRNFVPWQVWQAHKGPVDCVLLSGNDHVFSGGDKRLVASDLTTGEVIGLVARDSGDVNHIIEYNHKIIAASSSGSIRTFNITHNAKNMHMALSMSLHSRSVNKIMLSLPSVGICRMHSLTNHTCFLFSASDDRCIRVWNVDKGTENDVMAPKQIREGTFRCLSQSDKHLFVGTSNSSVLVFTKDDFCEREDIHMCNMPGADKTFCLQVTLNLPPSLMSSGTKAVVTDVVCTGYDFVYSHLWAADSTGQITVWQVPYDGLGFRPEKAWYAHYFGRDPNLPFIGESIEEAESSGRSSCAVRAMASTYRHMVSVGDDGCICLFDLVSFDRIKRLNVNDYCIEKNLFSSDSNPHVARRLRSLHVWNNSTSSLGRLVAVGSSMGDIMVLSLGGYV